MYSPGYFCEIHTSWLVYLHIWIQKARILLFKPLFVMFLFFVFILLLVSHIVLGKRVEGVFCSQNPCVFFSSVYVVFECCCVYL